ncbi:MAG: response regulator transcription factor [Tabrizicola sp.]|uniref:response regulator transcription factor n=1 Tax=Tabrizicola sp. TaxID=2005166 RepID=UPI002ABC1880|nr:response regulator transcription factor [Tabrizicola sp.]MDZ4086241.1 response regulator transcription factor [Tabrizicola sp.]
MADRLSIAIIDANPLLADGIAALLTQDDSFAARTVFLGSKPGEAAPGGFDVIIIDPAQVDVTPAQLSRELRGRGGAMVAYCSSLSESLAHDCIVAGFHGVLPKTVSFDVLKIALATTARGGIFIDKAFAAAIAPRPGAEDPPAPPVQDRRLSEREMFVLKSVAHGKSLKEIGRELDLSSKTIETYKARGTSKLNLSGRRQIVEFAIAQGWVDGTSLTAG